MTQRSDRVAQRFVEAAAHVTPAPGTEVRANWWRHGHYRHSPSAAVHGPSGPVALAGPGVRLLELAVSDLSKDGEVSRRWSTDELWDVSASLVAFLAEQSNPLQAAQVNLHRLRNSPACTVVLPVANVSWSGAPMTLGAGVILGTVGPAFFDILGAHLPIDATTADEVVNKLKSWRHRAPVVAWAASVPGQGELALEQAMSMLDNLCNLAVMLAAPAPDPRPWQARGPWNRPGTRGLVLDRGVAETVLAEASAGDELGVAPIYVSQLQSAQRLLWYGAEPLELQSLLETPEVRGAVVKALHGKVGVATRLRVAARWYAETVWSSESLDYPALALGVALDALVGSRSGLPGRALKERFALLEPDPYARRARADEWEALYSVRSAVAHGGRSSALSASFVARGQAQVAWAAHRLLAAEACFAVATEKQLETLFENLRWGVQSWPSK